MPTKLVFPHQIKKEQEALAKYFNNKVKKSPLNYFVKPEPMIYSPKGLSYERETSPAA